MIQSSQLLQPALGAPPPYMPQNPFGSSLLVGSGLGQGSGLQEGKGGGLFGLAGNLNPPRSEQPFMWGANGQAISQSDIDFKRKRAAQMMAAGSDFSPVQHWTQGLARVAQGVVGGLQMREADKQARAAQEANARIAEAILAPSPNQPAGSNRNQAIIAALQSDDARLQKMGQMVWERNNPKPVQPHYWESNNGSLLSTDGSGVKEVYHDPTPKMNFIPDGMGGGMWQAVPTQMAPASPQPAIGAVVSDPRKAGGGGAGNGVGTFQP